MIGIGNKIVPLPSERAVGLDHQMPPQWILWIGGWAQHLENRESRRAQVTLTVWWCCPCGHPPNLHADRVDPFRLAHL